MQSYRRDYQRRSNMQSIRKMMLSLLLGAFMVAAPLTHSAEAKTHHAKHIRKTTHTKVIHTTALRSGTMIVPSRSTAYVPSPNRYDNGSAAVTKTTVTNKARERWANVKQTVRYDTYRLSHGGKTSAEEQRQDAQREAQDRAHEQQYKANTGQSR